MSCIFRYTLGPVKDLGLIILKESIRKLKTIYPEFDIVICHNQLNDKQLNFIKKLKVHLHEQKYNGIGYKPTVENWKMYPQRLDITKHEIVMDNDIVLFDKFEEIDNFLISNNSTLTAEDTSRNLGKYDKFLKLKNGLNCGIFGMPPGFDFSLKMNEMCQKDTIKKWTKRYDDQGIISAAMSNHPYCIIIPLKKLPILSPQNEIPDNEEIKGIHFAYSNRSNYHRPWIDYVNRNINI